MTAEEKLRKKAQENVDAIRSAGETASQGLAQAGAAQVADLEAAEQERVNAYNTAQQLFRNQMDQGHKDFADIVNAARTNTMAAEQEAATINEANKRAARWTGAAELAASMANLYAVGQHNAVSQQYKPYSQDWMRKADQDAREHRARIDNLRERQRALQQHQIQLRMGEAGQALANAQREAEAARQARAQIAGARYQATANPLNLQLQTAEKAAEAGMRGETQAVNAGFHERQMAQSAAQHAAALAQRDRQFNAQMEAQGYELKDGHWVPNIEKMKTVSEAKALRSGRGSTSGIEYPIIDATGKVNIARLKKEEMETILSIARGSIADDLGEEDARKFQNEFDDAEDDKGRNSVLQKWMGKSAKVEEAIRAVDPSYAGRHSWASKDNPYAGNDNKNSIDSEFGV